MAKSKRLIPKRKNFFERYRGDAIFALLLIALGAGALFVWGRHTALNSAGDTLATNPIGVEQSSHATDTDIANLQAAENGALNQPALIWFHADW